MDAREERGLQIAALCRIDRKHGFWIVPSQSGKGRYWVRLDADEPHCTCPDFEERGQPCKHIHAVQFVVKRESNPDGSTTITEAVTLTTKRTTYKQAWPAYNAAQTNEKDKFQALLHDLCRGIPEPPQTKGRPRLSLADMIFSAAFKVYSTISCRRFMCDLREAQERGHIGKAPHYNSVFTYLEMKGIEPILRDLIAASSLPLKAVETAFAVDSSGFSTSRFDRWYDAKYGGVRKSQDWVKVHLICGVTTNIVTAVEIAGQHSHDSPQFAPLAKATARNFTIREMSGDNAYASNANMELVESLGGKPYFAFAANTTGGIGGLFEKMFHYYSLNRDEYASHYHKRSNVESTFSMMKAKFGDHIRSKMDVAMRNEALCKVLCHNICCVIQSMYELGIDPVFWAETSPAQKVG